MKKAPGYFLFSVDLEDVRLRMNDGLQYKERVPEMVEKYLMFLQKENSKATFFTVGDMAEKYPSLIKSIDDEGHEIACHSYNHLTIDSFKKDTFKKDLSRNVSALVKAGVRNIYGYRAPVFSLVDKTQWAYEILNEFGFVYSSSVLPVSSPLYGWPGFGKKPKMIGKLLEIPMSVQSFGFTSIPFGGGVYFRMLPPWVIKNAFRLYYRKHKAVLGYFHPYDIDTEQEQFMHPGINNSKLYNKLMYYKRDTVFDKLEMLMSGGIQITTYIDYIKKEKLIVS